VNETLGRVAFGFGAVLMWIIVGVMCVIGFRRLRRR
jgi:membrane protein required for beta-lactamase induction